MSHVSHTSHASHVPFFHRGRLSRKPTDCAAIFVHAGAGYHSITNETVHLQACEEYVSVQAIDNDHELTISSAARLGMAVLRAGGTAVDAVETAIKVLEDREITNAGYGSNLAIDGVVEGDAVVVDHLGRSGAVGAVARESCRFGQVSTWLTFDGRDQESNLFSTPHTRSIYARA